MGLDEVIDEQRDVRRTLAQRRDPKRPSREERCDSRFGGGRLPTPDDQPETVIGGFGGSSEDARPDRLRKAFEVLDEEGAAGQEIADFGPQVRGAGFPNREGGEGGPAARRPGVQRARQHFLAGSRFAVKPDPSIVFGELFEGFEQRDAAGRCGHDGRRRKAALGLEALEGGGPQAARALPGRRQPGRDKARIGVGLEDCEAGPRAGVADFGRSLQWAQPGASSEGVGSRKPALEALEGLSGHRQPGQEKFRTRGSGKPMQGVFGIAPVGAETEVPEPECELLAGRKIRVQDPDVFGHRAHQPPRDESAGPAIFLRAVWPGVPRLGRPPGGARGGFTSRRKGLSSP